MPRVTWPLLGDRPSTRVVIVALDGRAIAIDLHADTGAGASSSAFDLLLPESDCRLWGRVADPPLVALMGAYAGYHYLFDVRVQVPALAFDDVLSVVGVSTVPDGFRGVAGVRFLNRFTFGNFGSPAEFGLES